MAVDEIPTEIVEVDETPIVEQTEAEAAASFAEGFNETTTSDNTLEDVTAKPVVIEHPPVQETKEFEAPPIPEPDVVYAKITDAQFQKLLNDVAGAQDARTAVEKVRGDAFGKIGGLERTIRQLQESTPVGQAITVKAEDLASFGDMPDIAVKLAEDLTKVLGKFKGTSPAPVVIDQEAENVRITTLVDQRVAKERLAIEHKFALERLADRHEDWETVVGPPTEATPFRTWLHAQGVAYETNVLQSWDPRVTAKALDTFKAQSKKTVTVPPKSPVNERAQRLAEAAPSKGHAPAPQRPKAKTLTEEFNSGFND
jgi:hypothetical protein